MSIADRTFLVMLCVIFEAPLSHYDRISVLFVLLFSSLVGGLIEDATSHRKEDES